MNNTVKLLLINCLSLMVPFMGEATTDAIWVNPDGGDLFDSANYKDGADPTAADARLHFRSGVTGDITLSESRSGAPNGFRIGADSYKNLNIPFAFGQGKIFDLTGVFYVYGTNTMTLKSGAVRASNNTQAIGVSSGCATLMLDGAMAKYVNSGSKPMRLGFTDASCNSCRISIFNGATLESDVVVGGDTGSSGHEIRVAGSGSTWVMSGNGATVGSATTPSCDNAFVIESGANVTGEFKMGIAGASGNRIVLSGVGSSWNRTAASTLVIGSEQGSSAQVFEILDGAVFSTDKDIYIGNTTSSNVLKVSGATLSGANLDLGFSGSDARGNRFEVIHGAVVTLSRIRMRMGPDSYFGVDHSTVTAATLTVSHEGSYPSASNCVMRLSGGDVSVRVSGDAKFSQSSTLEVEVSGPNVSPMLKAKTVTLVGGATIRISAADGTKSFASGEVCTVLESEADINLEEVKIELGPNMRILKSDNPKKLQVRYRKPSGLILMVR